MTSSPTGQSYWCGRGDVVRFREADLVGGADRWMPCSPVAVTPELALDALGIAGVTAHLGMTFLPTPPKGGTLVVSAASGACGSMAGQIGRACGYTRVVGITSTEAKARFIIDEFGFDAAVVHAGKSEAELTAAVLEACHGEVDCYYDNVGGDISAAVAQALAPAAKCGVCGTMSQMGEGTTYQRWVELAKARGASVHYFRYTSIMYAEGGEITDARRELKAMVEDGRLRVHRTYFESIASAPACFCELFSGGKLGKALVRIGAPRQNMALGSAPRTS